MYLQLPQGFLTSSDAYVRSYDEFLKAKIVGTLLCDTSFTFKTSFFHLWDYLRCAKNGIVINEFKFEFCKDIVFAELKITPTSILPTDKIFNAIQDLPQPMDITGARPQFELVKQVAWTTSISPLVQLFSELVKANSKFTSQRTHTHIFWKLQAYPDQQSEGRN